jgi:hypothetical protein
MTFKIPTKQSINIEGGNIYDHIRPRTLRYLHQTIPPNHLANPHHSKAASPATTAPATPTPVFIGAAPAVEDATVALALLATELADDMTELAALLAELITLLTELVAEASAGPP